MGLFLCFQSLVHYKYCEEILFCIYYDFLDLEQRKYRLKASICEYFCKAEPVIIVLHQSHILCD